MGEVRQYFDAFLHCFISHFVIRTALLSLLSSHNKNEIDELTQRFNLFKQQFDRGVAVQSAATLEMLLKDLGTFLQTHFRFQSKPLTLVL